MLNQTAETERVLFQDPQQYFEQNFHFTQAREKFDIPGELAYYMDQKRAAFLNTVYNLHYNDLRGQGTLSTFHGPMRSGKTETALNVAKYFETNGYWVTYLKTSINDRDQTIQSNDGSTVGNCVVFESDEQDPYDPLGPIMGSQILYLDEYMFLDERYFSILTDVIKYRIAQGRHTILSGLDTDFKKDEWPNYTKLQELIMSLGIEEGRLKDVRLHSICDCCQRFGAEFTQREVKPKTEIGYRAAHPDDPVVLVEGGGKERYKSHCGRCHTLADEFDIFLGQRKRQAKEFIRERIDPTLIYSEIRDVRPKQVERYIRDKHRRFVDLVGFLLLRGEHNNGPSPDFGRIAMIAGPRFAGKSTIAMNIADFYEQELKKTVIRVQASHQEPFATHDGMKPQKVYEFEVKYFDEYLEPDLLVLDGLEHFDLTKIAIFQDVVANRARFQRSTVLTSRNYNSFLQLFETYRLFWHTFGNHDLYREFRPKAVCFDTRKFGADLTRGFLYTEAGCLPAEYVFGAETSSILIDKPVKTKKHPIDASRVNYLKGVNFRS